jgi:cytochrome c oxidase accessory protein FixG
MIDDSTLIIAYDAKRGEPRGAKDAKTAGSCIECSKCVTCCPQGIDIRNGFQLECIGCARCVDACTGVMAKLGHETLVDYGSLATLARKRRRVWRPRTAAYAAVLTTIAATLVLLVSTRVPFEASVARAPGSLFTVDPDGYVRNTYLLRVANNAPGEAVMFRVELDGVDGAELVAPPFELEASEGRMVPVVIRMPVGRAGSRTVPVRMRIATPTSERTLETTFKSGGELGP